MITVMVMTDGRRECIVPAVESLARLQGPVSARVMHDDSADPDYRLWLLETFPGWTVVSTGKRSGFGGAVRSARNWLINNSRSRYTWWHEDDFVLTRDIDLPGMMQVLGEHRHLTQLALRRQPWNDRERAAGGVVEQYPADFTEWSDGTYRWLEHRRWFTTNPALLPRWIVTDAWPDGPESEGHYGIGLFRDPNLSSGYWGAYSSGEWCEHIGHERMGSGY